MTGGRNTLDPSVFRANVDDAPIRKVADDEARGLIECRLIVERRTEDNRNRGQNAFAPLRLLPGGDVTKIRDEAADLRLVEPAREAPLDPTPRTVAMEVSMLERDAAPGLMAKLLEGRATARKVLRVNPVERMLLNSSAEYPHTVSIEGLAKTIRPSRSMIVRTSDPRSMSTRKRPSLFATASAAAPARSFSFRSAPTKILVTKPITRKIPRASRSSCELICNRPMGSRVRNAAASVRRIVATMPERTPPYSALGMIANIQRMNGSRAPTSGVMAHRSTATRLTLPRITALAPNTCRARSMSP